MRKVITYLVIAALGACAGTVEQLKGRQLYQGLGHNPGWLLTLDDDTLRFVASTPKTVFEILEPFPEATAEGRRYVAEQIRLEVVEQPCNDALSGVAFSDTLVITTKDTTYRGCGGERVPTLDR